MEEFAKRLQRRTMQWGARSATPPSAPPTAPPPQPLIIDQRKLLNKLEELTMQLQTSHEVNRHLNGEVEAMVLQVDALQKEIEAHQRHTEELTEHLTRERREREKLATSAAQQSHAISTPVTGQLAVAHLNALDNGATPEDIDDGQRDGDFLSDERWKALRRIGEACGWLVDPREVSLGQLIGEGTFGQTFRGSWRGGEAAIKCVRIAKETEAASFLREVAVLAAIRHPNVMHFYGACLQPPERCWLLCELLPGGTLSRWLHGDRAQGGRGAPRRSLEEKVRMALGVAQGMQALEAAEPPVLHRDLKPSNVLLDAAGHPRVADMGLARRLTPASATSLTGETGTYVYMAPEMIRHELYTGKADVYSWGVLLAETLAQRPPYEGLYLTPVQVALAVGDDELRPTLPPDTPEVLASIAAACYDPDPQNRPSFALIVHHMRKVLAELVDAQQALTQQESGIGRFFKAARPAAATALAISS